MSKKEHKYILIVSNPYDNRTKGIIQGQLKRAIDKGIHDMKLDLEFVEVKDFDRVMQQLVKKPKPEPVEVVNENR